MDYIVGVLVGMFIAGVLAVNYVSSQEIEDQVSYLNEVECVKATDSPCEDKWQTVWVKKK